MFKKIILVLILCVNSFGYTFAEKMLLCSYTQKQYTEQLNIHKQAELNNSSQCSMYLDSSSFMYSFIIPTKTTNTFFVRHEQWNKKDSLSGMIKVILKKNNKAAIKNYVYDNEGTQIDSDNERIVDIIPETNLSSWVDIYNFGKKNPIVYKMNEQIKTYFFHNLDSLKERN
jgi:hypothetical protein